MLDAEKALSQQQLRVLEKHESAGLIDFWKIAAFQLSNSRTYVELNIIFNTFKRTLIQL